MQSNQDNQDNFILQFKKKIEIYQKKLDVYNKKHQEFSMIYLKEFGNVILMNKKEKAARIEYLSKSISAYHALIDKHSNNIEKFFKQLDSQKSNFQRGSSFRKFIKQSSEEYRNFNNKFNSNFGEIIDDPLRKIKILESKAKNLEELASEKATKNQELNSTNQKLESKIKFLNKEIDDLNKKIIDLRTEIQCNDVLKKTEGQNAESQKLIMQEHVLQNELRNNKLQQQIKKLENDLEKISGAFNKKNQENERLTEEQNYYKAQIVNLNKSNNNKKEMEEQLTDLQAQINNLKIEIQVKSNLIATYELKINSQELIINDLKNIKELIQEKENDLQKLSQDKENIELQLRIQAIEIDKLSFDNITLHKNKLFDPNSNNSSKIAIVIDPLSAFQVTDYITNFDINQMNENHKKHTDELENLINEQQSIIKEQKKEISNINNQLVLIKQQYNLLQEKILETKELLVNSQPNKLSETLYSALSNTTDTFNQTSKAVSTKFTSALNRIPSFKNTLTSFTTTKNKEENFDKYFPNQQ